jgi:hypothetical protein
LAQGFTAATVSNSDRDLLSMRSMKKLNALYMVLRIVFLVVLGAAFAFMKSMAIGSDDATKLIMLVGVIAAFIGALLLEVLAQAGAAPWIGQIIYFLLIAKESLRVLVNGRNSIFCIFAPGLVFCRAF